MSRRTVDFGRLGGCAGGVSLGRDGSDWVGLLKGLGGILMDYDVFWGFGRVRYGFVYIGL